MDVGRLFRGWREGEGGRDREGVREGGREGGRERERGREGGREGGREREKSSLDQLAP